MRLSHVEIGMEVLKVTVLAWFLFYAFNDAQYPTILLKPTFALIKAALIVAAYMLGHHFGNTHKEGWRTYLLIFYAVSIITLVAWAGLGMHTEDSDPLFGSGTEVEDFIPTHGERDDHAVSIFLTLLIPAAYGAYKKRNQN